MKTISEKLSVPLKIFTPPNGLLIFLFGLLNLFAQHIYIWSLVVFPSASILIIVVAFSGIFFFIALVLSFFNIMASFILRASGKVKTLSICFSVVLMIVFLNIDKTLVNSAYSLYPNNQTQLLVAGAQTRVIWAGGVNKVKNDALKLLSGEPDEDSRLSSELWGSSIKRLGASGVQVDKATQSVVVYLPISLIYDFDEFGYLITNQKTPNFSILEVEGTHIRHWELGEGVYFFHRDW